MLSGERIVRHHYAPLPALCPAVERAALAAEAWRLRGSAKRHTRDGYRLAHGAQLLSPAAGWANPHGELLRAGGDSIAARLGIVAPPSVVSYLYYRPGDFIGLHTDQRSCQRVVLILLAGDPGPLFVLPELRELAPEDQLRHAVAHRGHPPGGIAIDLREGPVVLAGAELPHHRPPHHGPAELILATYCFARIA